MSANGYQTVLQKTDQNTEKIRIIGLVKEEMRNITKVRNDLMTKDFPSIWLEITRSKQKNLLICSFYLEWTRNGNNSENKQSVRLKILINQMEQATNKKKTIILLGDANLCADQWDEETYYQYKLATELKSGLAQCGLENLELGKTYMADRLRKDGTIIEMRTPTRKLFRNASLLCRIESRTSRPAWNE